MKKENRIKIKSWNYRLKDIEQGDLIRAKRRSKQFTDISGENGKEGFENAEYEIESVDRHIKSIQKVIKLLKKER